MLHGNAQKGLGSAVLAVLVLCSSTEAGTTPGHRGLSPAPQSRDLAARRERALELLSGYGPVLDLLPLDRLKAVALGPWFVEFRFDFGKRGLTKVKLAPEKGFALEVGREGDPLRTGRPVKTRTKGAR